MRYRIDHCEFPAPDTLERIYELKPSVTIQPGYSWMDKRFMRSYERMLDKDMINQQIPLRDFADAGVVLVRLKRRTGADRRPVFTDARYERVLHRRQSFLPLRRWQPTPSTEERCSEKT